MHHPQVNSDEERRPLFVSQPLQPSDYHTLEKSHLVSTSTPSNTNDINSALRSDGRNTSDSETEDDSDDGDLSSDQSSASSIALDTSIANEEAPFQGSGSSTLFGRRHSRRRLSYRLQMLLTVLSQLGILVFFGTLAGVIAKAPWVYPYSWHPICMGLYGFLATEAILILQPIEKATQKRSVKTLHGYIQSLAFLFSVAGFVAIYVNKDLRGKEHFTSNHAYYGSTAVFVFFLQVLFGTSVAYLPRRVFNWIGYARIVRIHRIVGYFSIALVWITLWLAALTNWMKRNYADHEWVFAIGIAMIAVGLVGQITPSRLFGTGRRIPSA